MIKKLLKHGILFIVAKMIVIIAPLYAAHILSQNNYGTMEWSLSMAMVIATILSVGAGNTIAFEKVKNNSSPLIYIGKRYSIYLGVFLAILSLFSLYRGQDTPIMLLGMSSFFVLQYALSAYMKASGLGARASMVDSSLYMILLVLSMLAWYQDISHLPMVASFAICAIFLAGILYRENMGSMIIQQKDVAKFFRRGLPLMVSSAMAILFFNIPKLLLGNDSMMLVGEFSLYFRWAALALVIYQFIIVVFFRDVYTKSYSDFDRFIALICLLVYLLGYFIFIALYFAHIYGINYFPLPKFHVSVHILMIAIIALWAMSASLEGLLYREDKSFQQIWANIIGVFFFIGMFYMPFDANDKIHHIISSWFLSFIVLILYQLVALYYTLPKTQLYFMSRLLLGIVSITVIVTGGI